MNDTEVECLPEEQGVLEFERDLTLIRLKCCCLIYFFVGLVFCIATIGFRVGSITKDDVNKNKDAYMFIALVLNAMNIGNIVVLVYSKYTNYKYRSFIFEIEIENSRVVYFIVLPLTMGSVGYFILAALHNFSYDTNKIVYVTPIVQILFYIAAVMLLIDIVGTSHTGENYHLKMVTIWAQSVTLMGVVNNVFFHFTSCEVNKFISVTSQFYNVTYYPYPPRNILYDIGIFMEPLTVTWGLVVFCFLLQSVKRNLLDIEQLMSVYLRSIDQCDRGDRVQTGLHFCQHVSTTSLFLGLIMITCPVIEYLLFRSLDKQTFMNSSIIFYVVPMPVLLVGLVYYVNMIRKMDSWNLAKKSSFVDRTLMWIGFFGQALNLMRRLMNSLDMWNVEPYVNGIRVAHIALNVPVFILQMFVMDLSLDRTPTLSHLNGLMNVSNSVFVLLCFNISRGLSGMMHMITEIYVSSDTLSIAFAELVLLSISEICISIYGMYSVLHFSAMLKSLYT